ncbi:MAG: hypothetical protein MZV65_27375 [Chromatiales bacterium]|jgi:hypothetical protein|nr:hypothetical protein [Chromatiales bacterium]
MPEPKPTPPARPVAQQPKSSTATATSAGAKRRPPQSAPIQLSSGDAKLIAAVLMEMLKR